MLTLYFSPGASSMAPHVALHEVGAAFDAVPVSFAKQEHQSASFRAINPEGKVPVLLIDGRRLTEVAGILLYLARRYPDVRLLPDDKMADDRLGDRDWAVGDRYSIADIHLFRLFWRFRGSLDPAPGSFPNLERHHAQMMERVAVKRTIEIESKIGYELPA